jgi:3D (Asp-Asp-Asp) domain-containing protein
VQATVTGYATGADGGRVGTTTATGVRTHWGTVAADWRLYPAGTRLEIEGFPDTVFVVEDRGGAVRGNHFDIWFPELSTAIAFGIQRRAVTILP